MPRSCTHTEIRHPCQGHAPMLRLCTHTKARLPPGQGGEAAGGDAVPPEPPVRGARAQFGPVGSQWSRWPPGYRRRDPNRGWPEPSPARSGPEPRRAERGGAPPRAANDGAPRPAQPGASPALLRCGAASSRAPPRRTGASRAEPSGAERSRARPDRTERSRTEAERSERSRAGPDRIESARLDEDLERTEGPPPGEGVTGDPPPAATPELVPPPDATGKDIIPVYCSLLAAVVVGLLAYVAFKCWHTCRQKRQLAKARAGDTGTSPDGEKLHSDSGVFLDTHSLQDPHQPGKAPRPEGHPLSGVPPQQREELERLLDSGGPGGDWRSLAARLGFGPDAIGTFGRGRAPTRTLLSTWAAAEGATLESLCQALAAIGRHDAARRLAGPGDVTSAV
ncbi:death domain-containing membrane protein NRADD-like [Gavia stellata]|uniref:death domain-containing membrane protein NRADD-like n=1 Tax=Gavia stellata TaxID=37040 RepID=UPI0028A28269|nr:death domain-containing membrane protein NRADD-like [Gavia stellata]